MFWNDNNFSVFISTNFWIDNSSFIMQDSGESEIIISCNWTCNSQLSIHIDFTTLTWFHFKDKEIKNGEFSDIWSVQKYDESEIIGDYKS